MWLFFYNNKAIAMDICEPGQDRNVAALSYLFMCGGLFVYENKARKVHANSFKRSFKGFQNR